MIFDIFQRALRGDPLTTPEQVFVRSMLSVLIQALAAGIGIILAALQTGKLDYRTMAILGIVAALAVLFHGIAAGLKNSPDPTDSTIIAPIVEQEAVVLDSKFADLEKGVSPDMQNTAIQQAIKAQMLQATGVQAGLIVPQGPVTGLINPTGNNAGQGQTTQIAES